MDNFQQILFDKSIYEIGMLPQRSIFASSGRDWSLSGDWHILYRETFSPEILEVLSPQASIADLPKVTVPLPLELQGFGTPQYVNVQYPFDGRNPGRMGDEIDLPNACMLYLKDLSVPETVPGKRYFLNFKGSESAFFLYLNGRFVGYSENLFLDSEFDVTPHLEPGVNRLGVLCFHYCASSWLLDQDFYRLSGLNRDVVLSERAEKGLFDADIRSRVDSVACTSHTVFTLTGEKALRQLEVADPSGAVIWTCRTQENSVTADFENLLLWSAETPNLYTLTVHTLENSEVIETAAIPFGFREVAIRDGVLLLNGKRLIFNGVNRHEWNMERGRSVTRRDMEFDVHFLKNHNINAVRTSHYPNHSDFYSLCDQAGLYMIDEACLESHGSHYRVGGQIIYPPIPGDHKEWEPICTQKFLRMYRRDKNHPAILLWSMGNEAGTGSVFAAMRRALLAENPDLLIHYEPVYYREDSRHLSDVYSSMYTDAHDVAAFIEDGHSDKPYILCEFAHAMGNSLGDLDAYRALLTKYDTFQGGFVWDYIDQGLLIDGALRFGGDNLDKPNDKDFCCNGILFSDRTQAGLSSKAYALKYTYQPLAFTVEASRITVQSRYLYRDTSHLDFVWQELQDGEVTAEHPFSLILAPGASAILPIAPADSRRERLVRVMAIQREAEGAIEKGTILAHGEGLLSPARPAETVHFPAPVVTDGYYNIGVAAGDVRYLFAKSNCSFMNAGLVSIQVCGEEFLVCEPKPTVFRAATSNDIGCAFPFTSAMALAYSKNLRCDMDALQTSQENGVFSITYRYVMDPETREGVSLTYRVDGSGALHIRAELDPLSRLPSLPQFGIHFQLPKDKAAFRYFGRGPYDNYPDRKQGCLSGIYESRCAAEFLPYIYPQECGNHEDVRWLEIPGAHALLRFTGPFSFKYLPNSDFEIDNATHVEELPDSGRNHLTISGFTRGVGGDNSWERDVHKEFTLPGSRGYTFEFTITPSPKR